MAAEGTGEADDGPQEAAARGWAPSDFGRQTPDQGELDADRTASPVPLAVARAAGEARDPRIKGIVLSRMFGRVVEPQRIGRFILLDRLGEGGMGVVYAAYDDRLDRKVAVKVLRAVADGSAAARRQRLLQEARALARLSHPNIVTVHEVGTHEGDVFVAMEHVRGQSLVHWLEGPRGEGRPWRQVVDVLVAAGRGLAAAHRAGIVHRDFKPHNVIVGEDGAVKVLDFGLARLQGPASPPSAPPPSAPPPSAPAIAWDPGAVVTRTGAVVGTPAYMAPEQHRGAAADERSDQYAFFVSLYQALHRQLPLGTEALAPEPEAPEPEARVREPPPGSAVPRWLHRAVLVGLSVEPARRYASMEAAIAAIGRDRAARRRRVLALGGLLAAVAATSAGLAMAWSPAPAASCALGRPVMEAAWGARARAEVEQGLRASSPGVGVLGEETWARLEPRLDEHADAWARTRDEICEAHRDGATSAALYDRQVACLELRRAAFEALVELLGGAAPGAAERALTAAAALRSPVSCREGGALPSGLDPPPDQPQRVAAVQRERQRLARVEGLEALGRHAEGIEQARAVVEVAEGLGHRPLLAEALVREGSLAMEHGAPDRAERRLTEALGHALASDHVAVAVEAVARRIFVRAERMRTPERAVDDVALGASLLERLPGEARLRGLYLNNVGAYHIRRGQSVDAREALEQALEVMRALGPDEPSRAQILGNLAIVEERLGRDEPARERLRQALALAERALGPHHPTVVELARLHGELLLRTGHVHAAEGVLRGVIEALHEAAGPRSPLHHGPLLLLGELALEQRRYAEAQAWFRQAAALEVSAGGGGQMYAWLEQAGLARAAWGLGEAERGRAMLERAADSAEASAAPVAAALRELLGRTLLLHDRPDDALRELRRAVALGREAGEAGEAGAQEEASPMVAQGSALARLGRLDEAELALAEALTRLDGTPYRQLRASALVERSRVATAQGRRTPALLHARAAVALLEGWGEPEHPDRARALGALALALRAGSPSAAERREADALERRAHAIFAAYGEAFASESAALDHSSRISPSP